MRKLLILSMIVANGIFAVPSIEAKAATVVVTADPQVRVVVGPQRRGRRWNNRRRVVTRTRIVRSGFRTYRETIRTTYLPNGRTTTRVIRRVRVR